MSDMSLSGVEPSLPPRQNGKTQTPPERVNNPSTSRNHLSDVAPSPPPLPPRQHNKTQTPKRVNNSTSTPQHPFSLSKQGGNHKNPKMSHSPARFVRLQNDDSLLHPLRRTHPLGWCGAITILVFCLLVIFFGIGIVIAYVVIGPKYPSFDIPNASLKSIYFASAENFNGDLTLLTNFTNPNKKISVRYDYLGVELFLVDRLIATQALKPFSQKPRQVQLEMVRFISSSVYMPPNPAIALQRQVLNNRVIYNIRGTFRVRAKVGIARFSYMLHAKCQVQMSSPPNGVLLSKNCSTGRST